MSKRGIRVMCVDDHAVVRRGIAALVALHADVTIVTDASSGQEALTLFRHHQPDVTLVDLQLPDISGVEVIKRIRAEFPDAKIIVLSMYAGEDDIYNALTAGASTYLTKDSLSDNLVSIIRDVHAGTLVLPLEISEKLKARAARPSLTPRELQVLQLLVGGLQNREIADALSISDETVRAHLKHIFAKLGVNYRAAAVRTALRRGLIHVEP
jgi:DNA-binding NarL/FixJ family response regulator